MTKPETLSDDGQLWARLSSLYAEAGRGVAVRAAVWTAEGMQFAGPFRSRAQFQSALRKLTELGIAHPLLLSPEQFWSQLRAAVGQTGGGWISLWPAKYLGCPAARIRLTFSTLGDDPGKPVRSLSSAMAYAAGLETWLEVNASIPGLSRGFEIRKR